MLLIPPEILDKKRKNVFLKLKVFKNLGYLAGGTALSLQIKHRHSFDFDIFFKKEIGNRERFLLRKNFKIKKTILNTSEQFSVITKDEVNITLVFYPYKNLFPLIKTQSIPLLSLKDIVADKAFTIGRRGTWRDYVDIFFILKEKKLSLAEIVKLGLKKFKEEFNEKLFLEQLIYFKDLGDFKISFIGKGYSEKEIKNHLINEVKKFQKRVIFAKIK